MHISEHDFFKRAVILICGNLDIEVALHRSITFFKQFMPADRIFLQLYDSGFGAMRTIAMATPEYGKKVDLLTPLSDQAKNSLRQTAGLNLPDTIILNDPEKYPVGREMLRFHNLKSSSLILMDLSTAGEPFGSLVIASETGEKFKEEHKEYISLLKEPFIIAMSNALKHREVTTLKDILADDNKYLNKELYRMSGDVIVGANFGLKAVMEQVRQVADRDTPVLLLGETGVGKDVIANAIHYSSHRREGPFVSINCGAIPETLIDSELFGHEKGSFTGALYQKRGRFERAHRGTIFLDEIGELPLNVQVRLLRVLENKEIERVGGTEKISLDIRIIAATNIDLKKMVEGKRFREDLWFRINVFPVIIPPLRERKSDIPALVQHFLTLKSKELKLQGIPELAPGAVSVLMNYDWPGNVRELENIIERALILNSLNRDHPITFDNLIIPSINKKGFHKKPDNVFNLDEVVRAHIIHVLKKTKGKIHGAGGAAELLGINASTLRNRMNKMGIVYGRKGILYSGH